MAAWVSRGGVARPEMRQFLYISPYFPPQRRVGALRPLKFVRQLDHLGWRAVVLCDLVRGDPVDRELLEAVPASTVIVCDYGWRARAANRAFLTGQRHSDSPRRKASARSWSEPLRRWTGRLEEFATRNPELIPLGEHSLDIPHATAAARRTLARHPCEAVVVNADPWAALLVGRTVARQHRLPLIADLRDPWAPCELRRPMRPAMQRRIVDRLERQVVEAAATVVLNTKTTRQSYVEHYPDVPQSRFVTIRNHAEAELIDAPARPPESHFTLLFLGNLRRFVEGQTLLTTLAELRTRGHGPDAVKLHVVGAVPEALREKAAALGVSDQVVGEPPVPYRRIGGVMKSADMLVAISHAGQQRIPAKIYDYLTVNRPLLAITDNAELVELLERAEGADTCGLADARGCADRIEAAIAAGRRVEVQRRDVGTSSAAAATQLAQLLDAVVYGN